MKTGPWSPFVCVVIGFCSVVALSQSRAEPIVSDRHLLARFSNSPDDPTNQLILSQFQATIFWRAHMVDGLVVIDCPNLNAAELAKYLSTRPNVIYAECSTGDSSGGTIPCQGHVGWPHPNLPALNQANMPGYQWAVNNTGQPIGGIAGTSGRDINLAQAWQVTKGDPTIIVAVIDAAISIDHPALVNSLWTNPGEIPNNGLDDDGDGIKDDVHGAQFGLSNLGDPRPNPAAEDDITWSHGTSCAGIICADPLSGMAGIAPHCKLMSLSLLEGVFGEYQYINERRVMALDYALFHGARVSNFSNATIPMPQAFLDLLNVAHSLRHVVVASAGNSYSNIDFNTYTCNQIVHDLHRYPAAYSAMYPAVIGVSATDNNDCLALYANTCESDEGSNYSPLLVLLAAPGWDNVSLRMMPHPERGLFYWFGGTSAAAPHVTGAVALLLSAHPEYTCEDVRTKLAQSVRITTGSPNTTISGGTLDVGSLLNP